jgi:OOP family OmpA-OmpF porin
MSPAIRWIVGIALALVAFGLWTFWRPGDSPQAPAKTDSVALADAAKHAATSPVAAAIAPVAPLGAVTALAPKVEEPVRVTVLFDFDRSALRPGEAPKLDELASKVQGRSIERVEVVGYADRIGEEPYNARLSDRRAQVVVAYLVGKGVDAAYLRADAKGESEPVSADACANLGPENASNLKLVECLQQNRRAEIRLVTK